MAKQPSLRADLHKTQVMLDGLGQYAVHCFWGSCGHIVRDFDSEAASRRMQAHYDEKHQGDLAKLGYGPKGGIWWTR